MQHTQAKPANWFNLHIILTDEETRVSWCLLAWHETLCHLVDTPTPTPSNMRRLRHHTLLNKHEWQLADALLHLTLSHSDDVAESRAEYDLATLLSDKRCWMNPMWTSKKLFREIPSDEKLDQQQSEIWLVEPWPLWTNKKTSQRHDTSCNRPPQSRQNESNDPLVLNAKNMFSLRSPCTSTNQQLADTLLHLPLPHWEDCTEWRNKEDLVTSLCDVSSDATHWPINTPNEPEARIENMMLRHGFWSRPLREQPPCKNLSIPTVSTLNLPDCSTQKFKHTRTNNLNFTNYAWSVVVGKQRRQDLLKRDETKSNLPNTLPKSLPKRNPTNCAAITTRCGLALMNRTYCNHSAKHLHLPISSWTQTRRLRGTNQKWPRHVALRKKVLDELIIDVWTETNEHEENEERQKLERNIKRDLEQQLQMKNIIKKKPPSRAEPTWK